MDTEDNESPIDNEEANKEAKMTEASLNEAKEEIEEQEEQEAEDIEEVEESDDWTQTVGPINSPMGVGIVGVESQYDLPDVKGDKKTKEEHDEENYDVSDEEEPAWDTEEAGETEPPPAPIPYMEVTRVPLPLPLPVPQTRITQSPFALLSPTVPTTPALPPSALLQPPIGPALPPTSPTLPPAAPDLPQATSVHLPSIPSEPSNASSLASSTPAPARQPSEMEHPVQTKKKKKGIFAKIFGKKKLRISRPLHQEETS